MGGVYSSWEGEGLDISLTQSQELLKNHLEDSTPPVLNDNTGGRSGEKG